MSKQIIPREFRYMPNKGWLGFLMVLLVATISVVFLVAPGCFSEYEAVGRDTEDHYKNALASHDAHAMATELDLAVKGFEKHGYMPPSDLVEYRNTAQRLVAGSPDPDSESLALINLRQAMQARWPEDDLTDWYSKATFSGRRWLVATSVIVAIGSFIRILNILWWPTARFFRRVHRQRKWRKEFTYKSVA